MSSRPVAGPLALVAIVTVMTVAADVLTKALARRELDYGEDRWLLEGVVGLELLRNRGIAFGLLEGRWYTLAMILIAVVALIWLIIVSTPGESWLLPVGSGGMLGGALGNLIDRLPDGSVTDFVAIGPWPRFNLADTALTLGLAVLAAHQMRHSSKPTSSPVGKA